MQLSSLLHYESDNVGVAVEDIAAGSEVLGRYRDQPEEMYISMLEAVPLGHMLATRGISSGEDVIECGVTIGAVPRRCRGTSGSRSQFEG